MYMITEACMKDQTLSAATKLVYGVILQFSAERPADNLSYLTIAQKIGIAEMTVIRCVRQLIENKWIVVAKNSKGWNCYGVLNR